jgi:hypothetical protein
VIQWIDDDDDDDDEDDDYDKIPLVISSLLWPLYVYKFYKLQ